MACSSQWRSGVLCASDRTGSAGHPSPAPQIAIGAFECEMEAGIEEPVVVEDDCVIGGVRFGCIVTVVFDRRRQCHVCMRCHARVDVRPGGCVVADGLVRDGGIVGVPFFLAFVVRPGADPRQRRLVGFVKALEAFRIVIGTRGFQLRRMGALGRRAFVGVVGQARASGGTRSSAFPRTSGHHRRPDSWFPVDGRSIAQIVKMPIQP